MNRRHFLQLGITAAAATALLPGCATGKTVSYAPRGKRGLGLGTKGNEQWREKLQLIRANWFYTWNTLPPENIPADIEFVPMIWGKPKADFGELSRQLRQAGYHQLLGLNEPDQKKQSNITVEEALDLWPQLMATGMRLGSPGCVHPDKEWMKAFMQGVEERRLRVDFVCVHSYGGPSADGLMKRLADVHALFQRPLWITEFGVGDWLAKTRAENKHSPEKVLAFVEKILPKLEACDFVERYAWFPAKPDSIPLGSSALFNEDGTLTRVGEAYRGA